MLNIIKKEREYWLNQIATQNNRLALRCAYHGLGEANKKWIRFSRLTKAS